MSKPNPETYARVVLWHLCCVRAELLEIQAQVASIRAQQTGQLVHEISQEYQSIVKQHSESLYDDAIREAGLN